MSALSCISVALRPGAEGQNLARADLDAAALTLPGPAQDRSIGVPQLVAQDLLAAGDRVADRLLGAEALVRMDGVGPDALPVH
jgi:hypothetical protein